LHSNVVLENLKMNIRSLCLIFSALVTATNAFVVPTSVKTCVRLGRSCSNTPKLGRIPSLPRTKSVKINSAKESVGPFTRLERKRRLATMMAFCTGWADLTLFLKYKTFATMMTGNTMWMAVAMVEQRFMDAAYYLSVILSYITGLSVFRRTDLTQKEKTLPICAFLVAGLFVGSDLLFKLYQRRWIPMMMLAMGFGIANSVGQELTGTLTFVITGHMTRLTNQVIDRVSRTAGRKKLTLADKQSFVQNFSIILGFFGGAAFAALLRTKRFLETQNWVFSAIGLSYAALFLWKDFSMESLNAAWWRKKDGEMCDVDDDGEVCEDIEVEVNGSSIGVESKSTE
jgi:uncharacterized membrane protein YoaK (UPF0700 family)